jgi:hypothetical protein
VKVADGGCHHSIQLSGGQTKKLMEYAFDCAYEFHENLLINARASVDLKDPALTDCVLTLLAFAE